MKTLFEVKKKRKRPKREDWLRTKFGAVFSECEQYRYLLWRIWKVDAPYLMMLMLNPSTADETKNDPTVAKCEKWARKWGFGGLVVCNIFAYRATNPKEMMNVDNPVGVENNKFIRFAAHKNAGCIVCAWGNNGRHRQRSDQVRKLLSKWGIVSHCLTLSKVTGEPGHPLYLKNSKKPQVYEFTEVEE